MVTVHRAYTRGGTREEVKVMVGKKEKRGLEEERLQQQQTQPLLQQ